MRRSRCRGSETEAKFKSIRDENQYSSHTAPNERLGKREQDPSLSPWASQDPWSVRERRMPCPTGIKRGGVERSFEDMSNGPESNRDEKETVQKTVTQDASRRDTMLKNGVTLRCMYTSQKHKKKKVWSDGAVRCCPQRQRVSLYRWSEVLGVTEKLLGEIYLSTLEYQAFVTRSEAELEMESFIVSLEGVTENEASISDDAVSNSAGGAEFGGGYGRKRKLLKPFKPPTRRAPPAAPSFPSRGEWESSSEIGDCVGDAGNMSYIGGQPAPRRQRQQTQTSYTGFGNVASLWDEEEEGEGEGEDQGNTVVGIFDPLAAAAGSRGQDRHEGLQLHPSTHSKSKPTPEPQSSRDFVRSNDAAVSSNELANVEISAATPPPPRPSPRNHDCPREVYPHDPNLGERETSQGPLVTEDSEGLDRSGSTCDPFQMSKTQGEGKESMNESELSRTNPGIWTLDERWSHTRSTRDILSLFGGGDSEESPTRAGVAEASGNNTESRMYSDFSSSSGALEKLFVPDVEGRAAETRRAQRMAGEVQKLPDDDKPEVSTASDHLAPKWTCGVCGVRGSLSATCCHVCGVRRAGNDEGGQQGSDSVEHEDCPGGT